MLFALVASGLWIVNSLYSIGYMRAQRRSAPDALLRLLRAGARGTIGIAFAGQPAHAVPVLRSADARRRIRWSRMQAPTRRAAPGASTSACSIGTSIVFLLLAIVWTWQLAGTLDFRTGGRSRRQARHATLARAARAVRVRHRQGRAHAGASLAAGGDGRADAGLGAAARRGGGEGRRLLRGQDRRLRVRRRYARGGRRRRRGCRTSRVSRSSPRRSWRCAPTISSAGSRIPP